MAAVRLRGSTPVRCSRSRTSAAALLVKVMHRMDAGRIFWAWQVGVRRSCGRDGSDVGVGQW